MGEARRRREAEARNVDHWSFPWDCAWCEQGDRFTVAERPGFRALARCNRCNYYMPVGDHHRTLREDDKPL